MEQTAKRNGEIPVTEDSQMCLDMDLSNVIELEYCLDLKAGRSLFQPISFCEYSTDFLGKFQFLSEEKKT